MARGSAEKAKRFAEDYRENCAAPALSLAVARGDGVIWQHTWGKTDLEFGVDATPEHLFRIGSVSKVLTTVAAAKLVSRGLLELDTPIAYWLPDLPERHRATTMLQLLTHRGGIRHYSPKDVDPKTPGGPIFTRGGQCTTAEILEAFIDDELVAPPGEKVSYSSFGYSLASLVMEAAAGQDFLALIDTEIAKPMHLASLVPDQPGKIVYGRARGYVGENERRMLQQQFPDTLWPDPVDGWANAAPINPSYCWAGAGFLMNMPDQARFGAAMIDGPGSKITKNERKLLFTPLTEAAENSPPLGLGWRVDQDAHGRPRWHHAGATAGGRAGLIVYPELDLSIALAGNTMISPGDVLGPAAKLADIFGA